MDSHIVTGKSWTWVGNCVGWPNRLASTLESPPSLKNTISRLLAWKSHTQTICNSLAYACSFRLILKQMEVTELGLTWVGWPKLMVKNLLPNLISTKASASHRKSTQAHTRPGQTVATTMYMWTQVFKLASTNESVRPGLKVHLTPPPPPILFFLLK